MRPQKVTLTSATTSAPIPMDRIQAPFAVGMGLIFTGAGCTATVQHTFDDILGGETATWFNHASLANIVNVNTDGNYAFPITAIRLNVSVYGSGSVILNILQGEPK